MECQCENNNPEGAAEGWGLNGGSVQMGAFTVVGYLLYRFSQTLPALIRWPIRLFCSLTGLSALWGWVGRLVGTLRGIQSLCKWLSRVWKFFVKCASKFQWVGRIVQKITGSSDDELKSEIDPTGDSGLRLILLGPTGGGRTSLADTLLRNSVKKDQIGPPMESTKRKTLVDGKEVTVINTPDILGPPLRNNERAREALRSLQLASPGPHAFLLVIQAPSLSMGSNHGAAEMLQALRELFGDEVVQYILPVLTHADHQVGKQTVEKLLDDGSLKRALSLCNQRPELVDSRPDRPPEEQSVSRRQLMERVMEMKMLRGHFVHELQRREDQRREELLADMTSALERKLGHM
ncbi:immune-associated nucleotide-binding protein 13-like [Notolabrus celidotus]|uniref:immune-associated nucleotide-binding protein 13-like n=1 Tax=Notolabrus celidotus TaxID=1203425 RepID=UPI00149023C8|nr:immune-associated nucleotide-binding protein 13-like [Notolabrus celidotus]